MRMTLRQMEYFVAVADRGSIAAAAAYTEHFAADL
jgi:DNA-binding transcriptional LysR family regulator